ncbi:MAG: hypothetical protein ACRDO1_21455, partial [Nocardioidaceae bacterium]
DVLDRALTDPAARADVDSGRLYESFWYVDSALTTHDPTRTPATRPPRGQAPSPGAGVLLPDGPVIDPESGRPARLRTVCRRGLTVLVVDDRDVHLVRAAVRDVVAAPVAVHGLAELDPSRSLLVSLGTRSGEAWVVRPDAAVSAIVSAGDGPAVAAAVRRTVAC